MDEQDFNKELFRYFSDVYKLSNEREMIGVLRSGILQQRIKEKLNGAVVSVERKGKFLHVTTDDSKTLKVLISEDCTPLFEVASR